MKEVTGQAESFAGHDLLCLCASPAYAAIPSLIALIDRRELEWSSRIT